MAAVLAFGAGLVGVAVTTFMARRERRARQDGTARLLDPCVPLLEGGRLDLAPDRHPRLSGLWQGDPVRLAAVSDSLTMKRLPQLWLVAALRAELDIAGEIALLARPTGAEPFALTHRLPVRLHGPAPLCPGLLARGRDPESGALLARLAVPLAAGFSDPRVKEIAVTRRGLRIVVQAREGQRGAHLLLRQGVFDGPVAAATAEAALDLLRGLRETLAGTAPPAALRHA